MADNNDLFQFDDFSGVENSFDNTSDSNGITTDDDRSCALNDMNCLEGQEEQSFSITDMNAVAKDEDTSCSLDDMNCEGK